MKKLLFALSIAGVGLLAAAPALGAQSNPHQEESDGCDHGATGKDCRPDPQPDHGQDCEVHGQHGGVNEDHCSDTETTSTTQPPVTTVTSAPAATTTTAEPPTTITSSPPTTTTTTSPAPSIPSPTGSIETPSSPTPPLTELPRTGAGTAFLAGLGTAILIAGVSFLATCFVLGKTR